MLIPIYLVSFLGGGCGLSEVSAPDNEPLQCSGDAEIRHREPADPPVAEPEGGWRPGEDPNLDTWWCGQNGMRHGKFVQLRPDGSGLVEGTFSRNLRSGVWMETHSDGRTAWRGTYRSGKRTGTWVWWHENGMIYEEGEYLAGRRQGEWVKWYPSGAVQEEGLYQTDQKTGLWTRYNDDEENTLAAAESWELGSSLGEVVASMADLTWIVGCWRDPQSQVYECWRTSGGSLRGARVDGRPTGNRNLEIMKVTSVNGQVTYYTWPLADVMQLDGRQWVSARQPGSTELRLREVTEDRLVFVGVSHGFPSRLIYRRQGNTMNVEMTGRVKGKPKTLAWKLTYDTAFENLRTDLGATFNRVRKEMRKGP